MVKYADVTGKAPRAILRHAKPRRRQVAALLNANRRPETELRRERALRRSPAAEDWLARSDPAPAHELGAPDGITRAASPRLPHGTGAGTVLAHPAKKAEEPTPARREEDVKIGGNLARIEHAIGGTKIFKVPRGARKGAAKRPGRRLDGPSFGRAGR